MFLCPSNMFCTVQVPLYALSMFQYQYCSCSGTRIVGYPILQVIRYQKVLQSSGTHTPCHPILCSDPVLPLHSFGTISLPLLVPASYGTSSLPLLVPASSGTRLRLFRYWLHLILPSRSSGTDIRNYFHMVLNPYL
jgi:hypothetical protein